MLKLTGSLTLNRLPSPPVQRRKPLHFLFPMKKPTGAEAKASAFSLSDEEIDHALRHGSGFAGGKLRIAALYESHPSPKAAQDFLKEEYGIGGHSHTYLDGSSGFVDYNSKGIRLSQRGFSQEMQLRWPAVEQHIRRMAETGTYLTEAEHAQFDEMKRVYADTGLPVPYARMAYPPPQPDNPEDHPELDDELPPPRHPQPQSPVQPPFAYDLHPGDTIYMDNRPFTVDGVRFYDVTFRDPTMTYPIYRAESKTILEMLLDRDPRNLPYRTEPLPEQPGVDITNIDQTQETVPETAPNFRITDDHLGEGGQKTKFENNIRAIRTLKTLEKENRPASPEDQEVLSQYVGWGGIPQAFDEHNAAWADEYRELKYLLTPEEYEMARASTLNAHYTSPTIIRAIYAAVEQMGFHSGNILEPSCGVGNFFGLLPESMENSSLYGVELDSITGRIAQYLYPQADIAVTGFEKTDRKDFFDLAIGNVPFGSYKVSDRKFDRYSFLIHDYFFAKALDQVRPGGIVAFITSKGTMDKQSPEVRKYIAHCWEPSVCPTTPSRQTRELRSLRISSSCRNVTGPLTSSRTGCT